MNRLPLRPTAAFSRRRHCGALAIVPLVALLLHAAFCAPALAQKTGPHRVTKVDNTRVEGELREVAGGYEITTRQGVVVTIKSKDVRKIEKLDGPAAGAAAGKAAGAVDPAQITDEEIEELIGEDGISDEEADDAEVNSLAPLPLNAANVEGMRKLAGEKAAVLETPHVVLVYTSSKDTARRLATRLESIYSWTHKFMEMCEIPNTRPEHKIEIYFFATHEEYMAFGNSVGGIPPWASGFYLPSLNRSAFYDLADEPGMRQRREAVNQPGVSYRIKQRYNGRLKRYSDYLNRTVIQHEAAHHMQFNTGVLDRRGDFPRWLSEGLAQMFEMPPGKKGGSLGVTNHYRLVQFNMMFRGDKSKIVPTRQFILQDNEGWPEAYPQAWALTHYLWKKHRDKFADYMRKVAARGEKKQAAADRLIEFESIFGKLDDKWDQAFVKFIFDIPPSREALDF